MLFPISKACDVLGVCARTLRRWEHRGILTPYRTPGNLLSLLENIGNILEILGNAKKY